jgi:transcriptional regulator with XRE-family HTH domain
MKSTGIAEDHPGVRIQARRERLGWTRQELAEKLGTTRMTVWRLEKGKTQIRANQLPRLAEVLRTTPARLVA